MTNRPGKRDVDVLAGRQADHRLRGTSLRTTIVARSNLTGRRTRPPWHRRSGRPPPRWLHPARATRSGVEWRREGGAARSAGGTPATSAAARRRFQKDAIGAHAYTVAWKATIATSSKGGRRSAARIPAQAYSAIASNASTRTNRKARRSRRCVLPVFDVLRNTPSRRDMPSIQARAVIQEAERLISKPSAARRRDIVVQWRKVQVMQIVAMRMSDRGSRDLSPDKGMSAKRDPEARSPVITSRNREKANINRSRVHPTEAMR